jgi:hypothetical protein
MADTCWRTNRSVDVAVAAVVDGEGWYESESDPVESRIHRYEDVASGMVRLHFGLSSVSSFAMMEERITHLQEK